jgi:glycosyltransferase involved in cell wall biosynthesis
MSISSRTTAIVIPAYNEAATIRDLVMRCQAQQDMVIVVDDGSTDDTVAQLQGLDITVIENAQNCGKATSLWKGMQYALSQQIQQVITLDGDGQHAPEDIPRLIDAARQHPASLIIAARLKNTENAPKSRLRANKIADFWISWAAGQKINDSQSGYRLYPAELLSDTRLSVSTRHGFVFESEIIIEAVRMGYPCHTVAIDSVYLQHARESHFNPVADITRIVLMVAWKLISRGMFLNGLWRSMRTNDGRQSI